MNTYEIEVSDFKCNECDHEVPCDTAYFSAVSFQDAAFLRENYCEACWKPQADRVFAFWRTRRPPLPSEKPKKVRFDTALIFEFFRRLNGTASSPSSAEATLASSEAALGVGEDAGVTVESPGGGEREELRFVLALLLVRKKALQFVNSYRIDGRECLKLVEKEGQAVHWVNHPDLDDAQLERVKGKLGELLQMQL